MHIRSLPIADAAGHILVHNVMDGDGRKALKKGTVLAAEDVNVLRRVGLEQVEVAVLDEQDVGEDEAATLIAEVLMAGGDEARTVPLNATRAVGGRVNLHVEETGVLYVDVGRLTAINGIPGVTLATRPPFTVLGPNRETSQVATLKIIPYALPRARVEEAGRAAVGVLQVRPLRGQRVALLITSDEASGERLTRQFEKPTRERLARLGSELATVAWSEHEEEAVAAAARELLATHDALIVGGQTSVMDVEDVTPRALLRSGAEVAVHGAPVEPGNLLALAYRGEQWIMCAPGCARSPTPNIVDMVLPRLIVGEQIGQEEIAGLGLGGLL
jgi:hypothetical protein